MRDELRAAEDAWVFTVAEEQQKSVAVVMQPLSIAHQGQMPGKFRSLLSLPHPLPLLLISFH